MAPEFLTGPLDQRSLEARPDVLTYTTQPLEGDTEITGPVRVQLWAGLYIREDRLPALVPLRS